METTPRTLNTGFDAALLNQLAQSLQLSWQPTTYGPQIAVEPPADSIQNSREAVSPVKKGLTVLSELAVLRLDGPDSISFLQGQLSNDVAALQDGQTCWAGYCTAKGRLLATAWVFRANAEQIFLVVARDIAPALAKRLQMFVMRAKTKVSDLSATLLVTGIWADSVANPSEAQATLNLPDQRALNLCTTDQLAGLLEQITPLRSSSEWFALDCLQGHASVFASNSELFVPQMINLDLVDGVNFKKGCYPGQEVVARSHYLGKNRLRMFLGQFIDPKSLGNLPVPGTEVFSIGDADQPSQSVGEVVQTSVTGLVLFKAKQPLEASALLVNNEQIDLKQLPYNVPDSTSA